MNCLRTEVLHLNTSLSDSKVMPLAIINAASLGRAAPSSSPLNPVVLSPDNMLESVCKEGSFTCKCGGSTCRYMLGAVEDSRTPGSHLPEAMGPARDVEEPSHAASAQAIQFPESVPLLKKKITTFSPQRQVKQEPSKDMNKARA